MTIGPGVEMELDEIRPGTQWLSHDATVVQRMQLLDEKNCDQRDKTHGEPIIA